MEFEWNIFPGFTTLQLVDEVHEFMNKMGDPDQVQERIIFMSMFNDIIGEWMTQKRNVLLIPLLCLCLLPRTWNLLLLDVTGLSAAFPLTGQGMHPAVAFEVDVASNEFGSILFFLSGFPETFGIFELFKCNRTRCGGGTCCHGKIDSSVQVAT